MSPLLTHPFPWLTWPDQAYYIAFSLIMLHTDFFNKNNKYKMQKADYVKNTSRAIDKEGISKDILEVCICLQEGVRLADLPVLLRQHHLHTIHPIGRRI